MSPSKSTKFPKHYASKFSVYRIVNQVIPSGGIHTIDFDFINVDILREFDLGVTSGFIPNQAGYYFFYASIEIPLLLATDLVGIAIRQTGGGTIGITERNASMVLEVMYLETSGIVYTTTPNNIYVTVSQNSGVNQNLAGNGCATSFQGFRIG